jgi:hypothetical protein
LSLERLICTYFILRRDLRLDPRRLSTQWLRFERLGSPHTIRSLRIMFPDISHIILLCLAVQVAAQVEVQCIPFQQDPAVKEKKKVTLTLLGTSGST